MSIPPQQLEASDSPPSSDEMTPEQLEEAKRYGRLELICDLADKALDVIVLGVIAFVFARPLDRWLADAFPRAGLRLAALFVIVTVIHIAISFPLSVYAGFVLEHRFGLSRQTFGRWFWRYAKRNFL